MSLFPSRLPFRSFSQHPSLARARDFSDPNQTPHDDPVNKPAQNYDSREQQQQTPERRETIQKAVHGLRM
jgi:hypothetical protein